MTILSDYMDKMNNSKRRLSYTSKATEYLMKHIVELEEKIDAMDMRSIQTQSFLFARLESKNAIGAVLSMKMYLKQEIEREHALEQLNDLQDLLRQLDLQEATSKFTDCKKRVEAILARRPAPPRDNKTNEELLSKAQQCYRRFLANQQIPRSSSQGVPTEISVPVEQSSSQMVRARAA